VNHALHYTARSGMMMMMMMMIDDDSDGGIVDAAGGREEGVPVLHARGTQEGCC